MEENDSIESLVRLAGNGDRTAFKTLYDQYHQFIKRHTGCFGIVCEPNDSKLCIVQWE